MDGKNTVEYYATELRKNYDRWEDVYKNGMTDPNWEDGTFLKTIRGKIIYYKDMIKGCAASEKEYPEEYYWEIPEDLPMTYMARADEIKKHAEKAYEVYCNDENYKWLKRFDGKLDKKNRNHSCYENIMGYVTGLRKSIDTNDVLRMRLHEKPELYLDSFASCRKFLMLHVGEPEPEQKDMPTGQLSIWDFISC